MKYFRFDSFERSSEKDNLTCIVSQTYEERFGSYYDLVQDFCSTVGITAELQGQGWFRNVFTETSYWQWSWYLLVSYNFACAPSEFDPIKQTRSNSSGAVMNASLLASSNTTDCEILL